MRQLPGEHECLTVAVHKFTDPDRNFSRALVESLSRSSYIDRRVEGASMMLLSCRLLRRNLKEIAWMCNYRHSVTVLKEECGDRSKHPLSNNTKKTCQMIKTDKLVKVYQTEDIETVALNEVNLEIEEGEFVAIMGPSGCGKSTLLNVLGMIDTPTDGDYFFLESEVGQLPERKRSNVRKHNLGFVFQSFNLIDELTVFENVELPMLYTKTPSAERKRRVEELLENMKMMHRRNHYPQQLSGGQQQRVAVARAIVNNPKLILADEPTGNLDSANGDDVMRILAELNASGTTIVMVTHSQYCAEFGNRIVRMLDGQVVTENVVRQFI